jgi:hypothetical protein
MTPTKIEITWFSDHLEIVARDVGEVSVIEGKDVVIEIQQPAQDELLASLASAD